MEIVQKVKEGKPLGKKALKALVSDFLAGKLSREQMTVFLRAVCAYGLSDEDTIALTEVMVESGERLSFSPRKYPYADKHSTGGVADSTTLIIAPIVAVAGIPFLKMSGRKLGHTGGTIDKLECFEGLKTELSIAEAEKVVDSVGAVVIAQTKELVPADKALYKLRDETDTVKSLPLIASSVVSKKLASGAEVLVLDVKVGNGAFMKNLEEGRKLARLMVKILQDAGRKAAAVLSDMNSPLGEGIGGVMEVIDAIEVLEGKKGRLRDLALLLASKILSLAKNQDEKQAYTQAQEILDGGKAFTKLQEMVAAQGGSLALFDKQNRKTILSCKAGIVFAEKDGYIGKIDCIKLGNLAREFEQSGGYGLLSSKKVGDFVKAGEPLVTLYHPNGTAPQGTKSALATCFTITSEPTLPFPTVYDCVC